MKPKVLVTRKLPEIVEERLASAYDVEFNYTDDPMTTEELSDAICNCDALMPTVSDQLSGRELRQEGRKVQIIANVGVGYSNIDTDTARVEGITVSNTPDVLTDATADIAMLLILAATRRAYAAESKLRKGLWSGFSVVEGLGTSIQGKVLGIVGMGRIGKATALRAALGFGMKIVFYNRSPTETSGFEAERLDTIEAVMSAADVVTVHVPGGGDSPLITREHIARMKPTAYLINTARGDSIDQAALVDALVNDRIAGAGLDVFENEPIVPDELRNLENVTLLPHIGSATEEVRTAMGMLAVDNLDAFFAGKTLPSRVV